MPMPMEHATLPLLNQMHLSDCMIRVFLILLIKPHYTLTLECYSLPQVPPGAPGCTTPWYVPSQNLDGPVLHIYSQSEIQEPYTADTDHVSQPQSTCLPGWQDLLRGDPGPNQYSTPLNTRP